MTKPMTNLILSRWLTCVLAAGFATALVASQGSPALGAISSTFEVKLANSLASAPGSPQGGSATFNANIATSDGSKPPSLRGWSIDLPPDGIFGAPVFDVAAGTCDQSKLEQTGKCPDEARLGTGSQAIRVDTGGLTTVSGGWTLYRGSGCTAGSLGCIASQVSEPKTGAVASNRATIVRVGDHARIQFESFELPPVLGITIVTTGLSATLDKSATLETDVAGTNMSLPRNFIENSTICTAGGWTYTSTLSFADGSSSSATANVPCTANPDVTEPDVQITYPKKGRRIRSRRFRKAGGTAFDAAGIKSVQYAIARAGKPRPARTSRAAARRSTKCQFLKRSGRLGRRAKSCSRPRYLNAKGTTKWRARVRRSLPRGPYIVFARASDNSGNTSRPRKLRFRIR